MKSDKNPYVMILELVDIKKLAERIQKAKVPNKSNGSFVVNNVYIRRAWRRKIPTKYYPIILEFYKEHRKEYWSKIKVIDKLIKSDFIC